jgi:hypothetical protein
MSVAQFRPGGLISQFHASSRTSKRVSGSLLPEVREHCARLRCYERDAQPVSNGRDGGASRFWWKRCASFAERRASP